MWGKQIIVQRMQYQAKPRESELNQGTIKFMHFYPSDLGPLAIDQTELFSSEYEGLNLDLPNNLEELEQITGRVFIEPEEQKTDLPTLPEPEIPPSEPMSGGFIKSKK